MRILVTGGVKAGKSTHAESLLADEPVVTYIATGGDGGGDPDWAHRIAVHRARRPRHWQTVETSELAAALTAASGAVLVDSLGTWLAARLDVHDAWQAPRESWQGALHDEIEAAATVLPTRAVVVSDEVGLGGVGGQRSTRLFADLLGGANQRFAAACDEVHLVVAGRVLRL